MEGAASDLPVVIQAEKNMGAFAAAGVEMTIWVKRNGFAGVVAM